MEQPVGVVLIQRDGGTDIRLIEPAPDARQQSTHEEQGNAEDQEIEEQASEVGEEELPGPVEIVAAANEAAHALGLRAVSLGLERKVLAEVGPAARRVLVREARWTPR